MITDQVTLSRNPEPLVTNFELLRAEGIRHLEELATHIWTDFNAHDPGITILEVLCYALTDLGYRVSFPLEDLLADGSGNFKEIFFPAAEVLSNGPVTEMDLRKLIIDVPGVKNVWLEKAVGEIPLFMATQMTFRGGIEVEQVTHLISNYLSEQDFLTIDISRVDLISYIINLPTNPARFDEIRALSIPLADEIMCNYGQYVIDGESTTNNNEIQLNGLYNICLDLHDDALRPESAATERLKKRVADRFHANRNLCEDLVDCIVVEPQKVCICLHLEIAPEADARDTMAKALYLLQDFLTPTVRFHTLQQLFEKGKSGDEIYNGPILNNGFLEDEAVENAVLRNEIFTSDLYDLLGKIPEVLSVRELKLDVDGNGLAAKWCYAIPEKKKPIIDVCCATNQLWISKGNNASKIDGKVLEPLIDFQQLAAADLPDSTMDSLPIPQGKYRPDLGEYTSLQYEFPKTYAVGENYLPDSVGPKRLAQVKQLQGFLLFFDRLLANYLKQLSKVRDLFSLNQDPTTETTFFQTLYQVPGVKDLLQNIPCIDSSKKEAIEAALGDLLEAGTIKEISKTTVEQLLTSELGKSFKSDDEVFELIEEWIKLITVAADRSIIKDLLSKMLIQDFLDGLQNIVSGKEQEHDRKNQLLNHLLARFGEQFTDFTLKLYQTTAEASANQQYLVDKANYLKQVPEIAAHRAKAYNYKLFKQAYNQPDVWNTTNIAGIKKRLYGLLGLPTPTTTASLFCDPNYRFVIQKEGRKNYLQMIELTPEGEEKGVLLDSTPQSFRKKDAESWLDELEECFPHQGEFTVEAIEPNSTDFQLVYTFKNEEDKTLKLASEIMPKKQAEALQVEVLALSNLEECEQEGFHLLEHILLRPNDSNDFEYLLATPATCELEHPPIEPYSFWISVILPGWMTRFKEKTFRDYFEQLFLSHTPAHIAVCFRWVEAGNKKWLQGFEKAFEEWREALAKCTPDECKVNETAKELVELLQEFPCPCCCKETETGLSKCGCEEKETTDPVTPEEDFA